MLTCIACTKQLTAGPLQDPDDEDGTADTPSTRQAIKALTAQIKDMALKASGAYRHCKPCSGSASGRHNHHRGYVDSSEEAASGSERFNFAYRRAGSTPREAEEERSMSGGAEVEAASPSVEEQPREWVAQVEPGVLITFVPLNQGGNDLKRIRFSRETFNKWQAQRWWAENYDKVMELYNVQRFNRQVVPLPTPPRSEDECSRMESAENSPVTPPLRKERLPRNFHKPPMPNNNGMGLSLGLQAYSSSDSLDHHHGHHHNGRHYYDSSVLAPTPKLSSISGAKTETSSMDASVSSREEEEVDRSGDLSVASVSNASEQETEWVEQDEPGVYITIRALPGGTRELRRVRFSREKFGEMHARLWWEENRARIHAQYL